MPGSKTYTSNKINELLEAELISSIGEMEKKNAKYFSSTIFMEIIKVSISLLLTALINNFSSKSNITTENTLDPGIISLCIFIFIIIYLLVNLIWISVKWLFDALINKRILPSEKTKGYFIFHKRIVNHIYLGISFENKYNTYLLRATSEQNNLSLDLATNYLSQSVHYFQLASDALFDLIPKRTHKYSEKRNAEFLDFIGFPLINVSLISAQRSLNRLFLTKHTVKSLTENVSGDSNIGVFKIAYISSIDSLFENVNAYVDVFEKCLERCLELEKNKEDGNQ